MARRLCIYFVLALLFIGAIYIPHVIATPLKAKRDYQNLNYYAIEVRDDTVIHPEEVAHLLDVRHEGKIGELNNHHLFSAPKELIEKRNSADIVDSEDSVLRRYHQLKDKAYVANMHKRHQEIADGLLWIEKQKLRQRVKRTALPLLPKLMPRKPPVVPGHDKNPKPNPETQPDDGMAADLNISDPGFQYQWHLYNTIEHNDINVTGVWKQGIFNDSFILKMDGITGKGIVVAIVDDGLDMNSEDLSPNFFAKGSYDFNDHTDLPIPRLPDDQHGTRCAGEIAAVRNDVCGVGVAYDAKIAGLRILSGEITDVDEAAALNYEYQKNHIYSCSWGPPDDGLAMEAPQGLIKKAIINGIENGRGGNGTIFVFATGNGGTADDNCNFDGYTNSLYTITVGAVDRQGNHPYYSEKCSAQMVVTYSSGGNSYIYTTDVGKRACYDHHGGTSAAAPLAAGIFALVLSVRPELGWRDMQHLCVQTAIPVQPEDEDWQRTAVGRLYNHAFGYGRLDAYAIVEAAKTWEKVGPHVALELPFKTVNEVIPSNDNGIRSVVEITQEMLDGVALGRLEHVTITVNIDHERRGDVEIDLISPNNVVSHIAAQRRFDQSKDGFANWTFLSVKHWEEKPVGEWAIVVMDRDNLGYTGKFLNWTIKLWGEKNANLPVGQDTTQGVIAPLPSSAADSTTSSPPTSPSLNIAPSATDQANSAKRPSNTMTNQTAPTVPTNGTGMAALPTPDNIQRPSFMVYVGFGAFVSLGIAGVAFYLKRRWDTRGLRTMRGNNNRSSAGIGLLSHEGRDGYEFEVLENRDDNIDRRRRPSMAEGISPESRRFVTTRELFEAFGDSDEDEDDNEIVFESEYMSGGEDEEEGFVRRDKGKERAITPSDIDDEAEEFEDATRNGSWEDFSGLLKSMDDKRPR